MNTATKVAAGIGAALLTVLVVVGGYQLGWWLQEQGVNRTTGIANDSLARQQALVDTVLDKAETITDIDVQLTQVSPDQADVLEAQRIAVLDQFCNAYGGLTGRLTVPVSVDSLYMQECA
jgi:hypothetical protein